MAELREHLTEHGGTSDIEQVRRMAAGDRGALAEIYRAHRDRVFSAVYRLVGEPGVAADLTHDTFLLVFERAAQFRGDAAPGTWIARIATNLALRHLRRERRRVSFPVHPPVSPSFARPALTEVIDLDRAVLALPDNLRAVLVLVAEGYSHAEAAELLGISEAACRQRLHRARVRLAATLGTGTGEQS